MTDQTTVAEAAAQDRADRRKLRQRAGLLLLRENIPDSIFTSAGFVVPAVLILAWLLVTALGLVKPLFLPSPLSVLEEAWRQVSTGILFQDAAVFAGPGAPIYLDIPEVNPQARELVRYANMRKVFETARMYKGDEPDISVDRTYGITTFELG